MTNKSVLNPHKPLLKSYYTNTYEKVYLQSALDESQYYLNQSEDFWDLHITKNQESLINDWLTKQTFNSTTIQEFISFYCECRTL